MINMPNVAFLLIAFMAVFATAAEPPREDAGGTGSARPVPIEDAMRQCEQHQGRARDECIRAKRSGVENPLDPRDKDVSGRQQPPETAK